MDDINSAVSWIYLKLENSTQVIVTVLLEEKSGLKIENVSLQCLYVISVVADSGPP